jgi:hypothetical protein
MSLYSRHSKYKRGVRVYLTSIRAGKANYSKEVLYKVRGLKKE